MNPLIINYVGGGYELLIPNVDGAAGTIGLVLNAGDEAASLRLLADSMARGVGEVVANSEFIFAAGGPLNVEGVGAIFESADAIIFGEQAVGIFAAAEGETLLDTLVAAGEALAEFLAF